MARTTRSDVVRSLPNGVVVDRATDADGTTWYAAWERVTASRYGEVRSLDGTPYGRLDTRARAGELPTEPAAQIQAHVTWELAQREKAYLLITRAFPEAREGFRSKGRIHLLGDPETTAERLRRKGVIPADAMSDHAPTFAGGQSATPGKRKKSRKK